MKSPKIWTTIAAQLSLAFGALLSLMLLAALAAGWALKSTHNSMRAVYEDRTVPLEQLGAIVKYAQRDRVLLMDMLIRPDPANIDSRSAEIAKNRELSDRRWAEYIATYLTEDERKIVARVEPAMKAFVNEGLKPMLAAIRSGKLDDARQLYASRVSPLSKPMMASTDDLIALQVDVAKSEYEAAAKLAGRTEAGLLFLTLASLTLGALLGWQITRRLVRRLGAEPAALAAVAQRSAQAARQIKTLIDDSLTRIDTGSQRVTQAGSTMNSIVDEIRRGDTLVGDITSASREQSEGIGQVNVAIAQLDQATQQNAALVEESAAAAASLRAQAERLSGVVAMFKLPAAQPA